MGNAMARSTSGPVPLPASLASAPPAQLATFGAGCYWGTERYFRTLSASHPGAIADMRVGFMGGPEAQKNPSYEDVCTGASGHVEVLQMRFDPAQLPYEALVNHFFTFHDPTTANRQVRSVMRGRAACAPDATAPPKGNDVGPQYASVIFAHTDEQSSVARARIGALQALLDAGSLRGGPGFAGKRVATEVRPANTFYAATEKHQRYLEANPRGYCNHMKARRVAGPRLRCSSCAQGC